MDTNERIAQFEQLCRDDATNDMAFFSLGGAYAQAGRHADAAQAYMTCIELNDAMSKAYQLAGQALVDDGQPDAAAEILVRGHAVADRRGDTMPKQAIAKLLTELGRDVPAPAAPAAEGTPAGDFVCARTGKPGTQMSAPPFRGPIGAWIHANISKQTFDEWIGLGTKIINELKLDLSRDDHDAVYDYGMRRYLGLDDDTYRSLKNGEEPPPAPPEFVEVIDMILDRSGQLESFGGEMHKGING